MTEAELARFDLALEGVQGDRKKAAILLEMSRKELGKIIKNNKALADKWAAKGQANQHVSVSLTAAPTELETMTLGPPVPCIPPVSPTEQSLAGILDDSDAAMRAGLASMGVNEAEAEEAMSLVKYYARHSARSVDLFGAMIVKRALRLGAIMSQIEADIKDKNFRDIYSPDGTVLIRSGEESKMEIYDRCLSQLRKLTELTHTGNLARAKIKMWEKHGANPNGKSRKPGFSPLQRPNLVNVQPGATVHINGNGNKAPEPQTPPPE